MTWGKPFQDLMTLQTMIGPDLLVRIEFYGEGRCDAQAMDRLRRNIDLMASALDRGPDDAKEEPDTESEAS